MSLCRPLSIGLLGPLVFAALTPIARAADRSILSPPPTGAKLEIYSRSFDSLSEPERRRIRVHGLRLAALNPSIWGTLRRERTHNRNLVPIKRYLLRASEQPGFEARKISARFKFKAADRRYMEKMPHQKDPVFEIGFGGSFSETGIADAPLEDRMTVVRLSAFPRLASGIFERNFERYTELSPATSRILEIARTYDLEIDLSADEAIVSLNGVEIARHRSKLISRGLVSLQTSWHPIALESLSIEGHLASSGRAEPIVLSGLVEGS